MQPGYCTLFLSTILNLALLGNATAQDYAFDTRYNKTDYASAQLLNVCLQQDQPALSYFKLNLSTDSLLQLKNTKYQTLDLIQQLQQKLSQANYTTYVTKLTADDAATDCDDAVQCDLPEAAPNQERYLEATHLIFWDNTTYAQTKSTLLNGIWQQQVGLLKQKIVALGVAEARIHIIAVSDAAQFMTTIKAISGPKRVYAFGHAAPLSVLFGEVTIDIRDYYDELVAYQVSAIADYGCSFVNFNPTPVAREPMATDAATYFDGMELFGHTQPSQADLDDSPLHPTNPIVSIDISCRSNLPTDLEMLLPYDVADYHALSTNDMFVLYNLNKNSKFDDYYFTFRSNILNSTSCLVNVNPVQSKRFTYLNCKRQFTTTE